MIRITCTEFYNLDWIKDRGLVRIILLLNLDSVRMSLLCDQGEISMNLQRVTPSPHRKRQRGNVKEKRRRQEKSITVRQEEVVKRKKVKKCE